MCRDAWSEGVFPEDAVVVLSYLNDTELKKVRVIFGPVASPRRMLLVFWILKKTMDMASVQDSSGECLMKKMIVDGEVHVCKVLLLKNVTRKHEYRSKKKYFLHVSTKNAPLSELKTICGSHHLCLHACMVVTTHRAPAELITERCE